MYHSVMKTELLYTVSLYHRNRISCFIHSAALIHLKSYGPTDFESFVRFVCFCCRTGSEPVSGTSAARLIPGRRQCLR
eukprot:961433-Rhodomonas_salina.2